MTDTKTSSKEEYYIFVPINDKTALAAIFFVSIGAFNTVHAAYDITMDRFAWPQTQLAIDGCESHTLVYADYRSKDGAFYIRGRGTGKVAWNDKEEIIEMRNEVVGRARLQSFCFGD